MRHFLWEEWIPSGDNDGCPFGEAKAVKDHNCSVKDTDIRGRNYSSRYLSLAIEV